MLFDYDDTNIESIYSYAKRLENMTFREILEEYNNSSKKHYVNHNSNNYDFSNNESFEANIEDVGYYNNTNAKGQLGGFLEKYYFGYDTNSDQNADFDKVGVELKQTPIDITKKGEMRAGERLSITNVSYRKPVEDDFYKSHVWEKIKLILLIQYIRDKSVERYDYEIKFVNLFTPPKEDLKIIIDDYNKINQKLKDGKAQDISEGDTMYLGACTKGASALKSMQPQYYGDHSLAKKRNYCFKQSYMNYVLHNYVLRNEVPYEAILKDELPETLTFEDYIINRINSYKGRSDEELCKMFDRPYNNNKAQWIDLAYRMLGIKGSHAEEFVKANVVVKAIRVEENGSIKENMSFPPFKFKELVLETWEDSTVYDYFSSTRFLFVVYKTDGKNYILQGAQLWNMPYRDLEDIVRIEWTEIRDRIAEGVVFDRSESTVLNNLPKIKNSKILHIRPHASKAAYKFKDGTVIGNVKSDANELPDGQWMTTQSFWVNNSYIIKQLKYI